MAQHEGFASEASVQQGGEYGSGENITDLIRQLTSQGSHLAEQQLNLVKAEVRESIGEARTAVGSMAGAVVFGIAGLGVTLMGLAYLLGNAIDDTPLATLIVGIGTLALAFVLYRSGASKIDASHLTPDRTVRTLERTPDAARGNLTSE